MSNSTQLALRDFHGPFNDFLTRLEGDEAEIWFAAFKRFLRKENPWETAPTEKRTIVTADSLVLDCSAPFNPAGFIGAGWSIWRGPADGNGLEGEEAVDLRSLSLTKVDFMKVSFESLLNERESVIRGEEKYRRFQEERRDLTPLGGSQFLALWLDYQANKKKSVLEWLRKKRKITYLDFFAMILRNPDGYRCVLCLFWDGRQWRWGCHWLDDGWFSSHLSAALAS